MKKILTIIAVLVVAATAVFIMVGIFSGDGSTPAAPSTGGAFGSAPGTSYGGTSGGTSGATTTLVGETIQIFNTGGESFVVRDVTRTAAADTHYPGTYYLAGGDKEGMVQDARYVIMYLNNQQSFTVSLFTEPLRDVRREAEQDLMAQLGISEKEMCALNYIVLEPYDLNPLYAGVNLGFSFCPGAVVLP